MLAPEFWRVRRFADSVPEIARLQQEMNRLFSAAERGTMVDYPAINVWEKDGTAVITAELPGMDHDSIDISVTDNVLTLSGKGKAQVVNEGEAYLRQERITENFQRNFKLPFRVASQGVEAKYEKGILTITLPRLKDDLPKKIKINS
ncbi:MAG TPA: Hsp20/alpha crystallin family protein [Deltaproteobacteria bacterium]|nr:Hsp20/alpha crystallin family protein [Deltaproteobacteria bacterium]